MQALVILKSDRVIVTAIQDVVRIEGNNIFGVNSSAGGIDVNEAEIFVTDSVEEFEQGQVFPDGMVNHIADFVKQSPEEIIAGLQAENAEIILTLVMNDLM